MTNIVVDKSTDNAEPHSTCFFTTIFNVKEIVYFRASLLGTQRKSKGCLQLPRNLGPVARSLVSRNHWLRGIKTYRFPWYLTLVSAII